VRFEQDWQFHRAVYDRLIAKAERHTAGQWDWDRWERALEPVEFDALLVLNFLWSWENNGSFVDTIKWFEDRGDRFMRAFRRLGFGTASGLVPRALELDGIQEPYLNGDLPLPPDVEAEIERVNQAATADVSEERLTAAITSRAEQFSA
jgi:hypothetical protein